MPKEAVIPLISFVAAKYLHDDAAIAENMKLSQALKSKFPVSQRATKAPPPYAADDGALKLVQLRQIKKTAAMSNPKRSVRTSLLDVSTG